MFGLQDYSNTKAVASHVCFHCIMMKLYSVKRNCVEFFSELFIFYCYYTSEFCTEQSSF